MKSAASSYWRDDVAELRALLDGLGSLGSAVDQLAAAMQETWSRGGKLMIAGNGGSAADAMHFAEELVVRFRRNRRALAALALTDPTVLTCAGNDFGFESVFARQVEALGKPGDLLVLMSTSGRSANLLHAAERGRAQGLVVAGLLGRDGGPLAPLCDVALIVPSESTARIQEIHKLVFHALCAWVDDQASNVD